MKKTLYCLLGIGLLFIGYLGYTYHNPNIYEYPGMISSNMYISIPVNEDDFYILTRLLKNPSIAKKISNLSGNIEVSFDTRVNFSLQNSIGYKILFTDKINTNIVYVRTSACWIWYVEDSDIITSLKPGKVIDIVLEQSGQQIILQGTGGSRIEQVKRGP